MFTTTNTLHKARPIWAIINSRKPTSMPEKVQVGQVKRTVVSGGVIELPTKSTSSSELQSSPLDPTHAASGQAWLV